MPLLMNTSVVRFRTLDPKRLCNAFLYQCLRSKHFVEHLKSQATGSAQLNCGPSHIRLMEIPLPPLDVQQEIVAEIEGYQRVIDGARAVVENYRPQIVVDPEWLSVKVKDVFKKGGKTVLPMSLRGPVNYVGLENITKNSGQLSGNVMNDNPHEIKSLKNIFSPGDILYGKLRPNLNKVWFSDRKGICSTDIFVVQPLNESVLPALYAYIFRSDHFNDAVLSQLKGAQLPRIGWQSFGNLEIPLPPLEVQQTIIAEIKAEQALVAANRELVERMEKKIKAAIARVWGNGETDIVESG